MSAGGILPKNIVVRRHSRFRVQSKVLSPSMSTLLLQVIAVSLQVGTATFIYINDPRENLHFRFFTREIEIHRQNRRAPFAQNIPGIDFNFF